MEDKSRLTPLPPTPRVNEFLKRFGNLDNAALPEEMQELANLARTLEQELGIAVSGWKRAEKDNEHLFGDNARLRALFDKFRKLANGGS